MVQRTLLNPHPHEFGRFLYASVGEDRNGCAVTVLSTLARLGLDPWKETAELVVLKRHDAQERLATVLALFGDVPALVKDHSVVARDLTTLLPDEPGPRALTLAISTVGHGRLQMKGVFWAVLAIIVLLIQLSTVNWLGLGK